MYHWDSAKGVAQLHLTRFDSCFVTEVYRNSTRNNKSAFVSKSVSHIRFEWTGFDLVSVLKASGLVTSD